MEGEKLAIIKTLYVNRNYALNRPDFLYIVVGNEHGEREIKIIREPKYTFYLARGIKDYHRIKVPINECEKITCKYSRRYDEMAKSVGLLEVYREAKKKGWEAKRDFIRNKLMKHPSIYYADQNIEDVTKMEFSDKYGYNIGDIPIYIGFSDIETRGDQGNVDQNVAEGEISSIAHLDAKTQTLHLMVTDHPDIHDKVVDFKNNKIGPFINAFRETLKKLKQDAIDRIVSEGGKADAIHSYEFNYKFYFPSTESDLIQMYFGLLKETKPDFVSFWNINYDMKYISRRCEKLGLNLADLASDDIIPPEYRYFYYDEDYERYTKSDTHYSRYFDVTKNTGAFSFYDQMSLYSNLRKGYLEKNYKLEYIAEKAGYIKKFSLKAEGYTIKDVLLKNLEIFMKYAMIDVIDTFMIEHHTGDMLMYLLSCEDARFEQGIKKTTIIKNDLSKLEFSKGNVLGNNISYDVTSTLYGAIIASPNLIRKKGLKVMGKKTLIFKNGVDLDLSAEYPNTTMAFGIGKSTTYGYITDVYHEEERNGIHFKRTISSGEVFNKMLETLDASIFRFGKKYFNLPSYMDIIKDIDRSIRSKK